MRKILLTALAFAALALAQAQPEFEIASVKPAAPPPLRAAGVNARSGGSGDGGGSGACPARGIVNIDPGRVRLGCMSLATLISDAYKVAQFRVIGPDWIDGRLAPKFNIDAKLPGGAQPSQIPQMLRNLLAARFGLKAHEGSTPQDILELVVAKSGAKLTAGAPDAAAALMPPQSADTLQANAVYSDGYQKRTVQVRQPDGSTVMSSDRLGTMRWSNLGHSHRWEAPDITLDGLVDLLNGVGPISDVVNKTGLTGRYRIAMEFSLADAFSGAPDAAAEDDVDRAIVQALNTSLVKFGLQLQRRKGTARTIIIDHLERSPSGN